MLHDDQLRPQHFSLCGIFSLEHHRWRETAANSSSMFSSHTNRLPHDIYSLYAKDSSPAKRSKQRKKREKNENKHTLLTHKRYIYVYCIWDESAKRKSMCRTSESRRWTMQTIQHAHSKRDVHKVSTMHFNDDFFRPRFSSLQIFSSFLLVMSYKVGKAFELARKYKKYIYFGWKHTHSSQLLEFFRLQILLWFCSLYFR